MNCMHGPTYNVMDSLHKCGRWCFFLFFFNKKLVILGYISPLYLIQSVPDAYYILFQGKHMNLLCSIMNVLTNLTPDKQGN